MPKLPQLNTKASSVVGEVLNHLSDRVAERLGCNVVASPWLQVSVFEAVGIGVARVAGTELGVNLYGIFCLIVNGCFRCGR